MATWDSDSEGGTWQVCLEKEMHSKRRSYLDSAGNSSRGGGGGGGMSIVWDWEKEMS